MVPAIYPEMNGLFDLVYDKAKLEAENEALKEKLRAAHTTIEVLAQRLCQRADDFDTQSDNHIQDQDGDHCFNEHPQVEAVQVGPSQHSIQSFASENDNLIDLLDCNESDHNLLGSDCVLQPTTRSGQVRGGRVTMTAPRYPRDDTRAAIYPHDSARLRAFACYLEDMSYEEQVTHWRNFARSNPKRHWYEWRNYYEDSIRPEYLASQNTNLKQTTGSEKRDGAEGEDMKMTVVKSPTGTHTNDADKETRDVPESTTHTSDIDVHDKTDRADFPNGLAVELLQPAATTSAAASSLRIIKPKSCPELFASPLPNDKHPRHTVLIEKLPAHDAKQTLLAILPLAELISWQILPTACMRTSPAIKTNSAMLVFTHGEVAKKFVEEHADGLFVRTARDEVTSYGQRGVDETGESFRLRVSLIDTATRLPHHAVDRGRERPDGARAESGSSIMGFSFSKNDKA